MEGQITDRNSAEIDTPPSLEYEYATTTTLHGIGRIAESRGARGKIPWVLVLLITGGVFVAVTVDRMQAYLRFDANTKVDVKFQNSLAFPAITICNYNRFVDSKIAQDEKKYVDHLLEISYEISDYAYPFEEYDENDGTDDTDSDGTDIGSSPDEEVPVPDANFNYTDFALATGFSLKESLLQCSWKGVNGSCDASNFSSYYSPSYGRCYTFNGIGQHRQQRHQGIGNGLQLIVDIKQHEYTETIAKGNAEAGLKFAVHPPDELPLMDTMGLSAAPGFHTYASMHLIRHKNLPQPWGVCGGTPAVNGKNYSRNTCLRNCRRRAIDKRCNCQPLGYDQDDDVPLCNLAQFDCIKAALQKHRSSGSALDCGCPVSCEYRTYEATLSTANFPSQRTADEARRHFYRGMQNVTEAYIEKNLVYLDVYFNDLSEIIYEQVEALPFTAMLGELGGQLGLFLGASVITGVELLDYILRRFRNLLLRAKGKDKVHSIQN